MARMKKKRQKNKQRQSGSLPISASPRHVAKRTADDFGSLRTYIGERISRRCYPQTRGFGQFIPRDEADVARPVVGVGQPCPAE